MKTLIIIPFLTIACMYLQAQEAAFMYDAAGRRVSCRIITIKKATKQNPNLQTETEQSVATSLDETGIEAGEIIVYPNPVQGTLKINLPADMAGGTARVWTVSGRLVATKQLNSPQNELDFNNLQSGVYLLRLDANGKTRHWKIIKE